MLGSNPVTIDADGRPRDYLGNHAAAFAGGDDEPDKGEPGGSCNRQACQRPEAFYRNDNVHPTKYYCRECAGLLNRANTGSSLWKDVLLDREVLTKHGEALKQTA